MTFTSTQAIFLLSQDKSLFEELFEYFRDRYFTVHMGTYQNFNFGSGTLITPTVIIVGIMIGVMIAGLLAIRDRYQLGGFVRTVLREKCLSPETAKTFAELGYDRNFMIRMSMQYGKRLRAVVHCVETETVAQPDTESKEPEKDPAEGQEDGAEQAEAESIEPTPSANESIPSKPARWDNETYHFYIPEDKAIEADIRFEKKGTSWLIYLALVVGVLAVTLAVIYFLPDLLQFADNAITLIKGGN